MMAEQKMRRMRLFAPGNAGRACPGKARWRSEESAQRAITSLRRQFPEAISSIVRPYRCRARGKPHWHVGHGS